MAKLLIVEDEADIRELISFNLEMSGFEVEKARDGEEGLALAKNGNFDLVILDLMLPGMDGLKVCSALRKNPDTASTPVIMLTARSQDDDVVDGLESGADDYITKPFSPKILIARVKAALRRSESSGVGQEAGDSSRISIHDIVIDTARHETFAGGSPVDLSATEFSILRFLAKNPGWVFSRNQIIDSVKGEDYPVTARSVDVQILGIRKKLGEYGNVIETVRGIGYKMKGE